MKDADIFKGYARDADAAIGGVAVFPGRGKPA